MSAQKSKRTNLTVKEKKEIIDAAKRKPNQSKLAREISKKWGVEVKKGILSKKDEIEAAIKSGVQSKPMKLMQTHDPKLDEGTCKGTESTCQRRSDQGEGDETGQLMHIPDFMTSNGWLDNLRNAKASRSRRCRTKLER